MKRKSQGHFCRICGSHKPNEAFSGNGHCIHICKICSQLPKEERDAAEYEDEIHGFLNQSHISEKNMMRLRNLSESPNARVAMLALLVAEIGRIKPYKNSRLKVLKRERPDLFTKLEETGLISAHHW